MGHSEKISKVAVSIDGQLTIWFSLLAAPRPVGPAPMTKISTELGRFSQWNPGTREIVVAY